MLLEALASGLPVLAIAALGTRSIVDPGRGAIAAATTPDAFAQQLIDMLGNPQRLAELAAEGLRFAHEWGADRPAQRLASLYGTLVARRASLAPSRGKRRSVLKHGRSKRKAHHEQTRDPRPASRPAGSRPDADATAEQEPGTG